MASINQSKTKKEKINDRCEFVEQKYCKNNARKQIDQRCKRQRKNKNVNQLDVNIESIKKNSIQY